MNIRDDEELVRGFMQRLANTATPSPRVLPADVLWLKAVLERRLDVERRVTMPLDIMEPVQIAMALAAVVFLLVWARGLIG
jgi:hypothetical protein